MMQNLVVKIELAEPAVSKVQRHLLRRRTPDLDIRGAMTPLGFGRALNACVKSTV